MDAKPDEIARAQLAVDGEIEQCKLPGSMIEMQPKSDAVDSRWRCVFTSVR